MPDPTEAGLALARFTATPLARDPFDHVVVPGFLDADHARAARLAFPPIKDAGLIPAGEGGEDACGRIIAALRSPIVSEIFGEKFGLRLDPAALMIHLRARCRITDGGIHADSRNKVVTCLLYLNEGWTAEGGRLRLLRSATDLDDMAAEVAPCDGTLIAFRRTDHSFHGHKPYEGVRRYIMFNWMVDAAAARREELRHGISSGLKRVVAAFG
jgi:hypothetical protein